MEWRGLLWVSSCEWEGSGEVESRGWERVTSDTSVKRKQGSGEKEEKGGGLEWWGQFTPSPDHRYPYSCTERHGTRSQALGYVLVLTACCVKKEGIRDGSDEYQQSTPSVSSRSTSTYGAPFLILYII